MVEDAHERDRNLAHYYGRERERKARRWLTENVRQARYWLIPDDALLFQLRTVDQYHDLPGLLDAICSRVDVWSAELHQSLADTLAYLALNHPGPGRDAVTVDYSVRRLLRRVSDPTGRSLSHELLRASRRARRIAAWLYYARYGLDTPSREVLLLQVADESHTEFRKLIAGDGDLVIRLGTDYVLEICPSRYWRSVVIEGALANDAPGLSRIRESYPEEWLWAVGRSRDSHRVSDVLDLLARHKDDADLVNRVLLCVEHLGDRNAIEIALAAAERVLALPPRYLQRQDRLIREAERGSV